MRVLIVDDEPLARQRLRELLGEMRDVEVVGEAEDGVAAMTVITATGPDLVFLDIQMPGTSGLELAKRINPETAVVFTTAHDNYAVAAFELQAIDYLLKPFGRERLAAALTRARRSLDTPGPSTAERLESALSGRPEHILVRDRGRLIPIATKDVARLAAEDDYTRAFVNGTSYLIYLPLHEFERVLDPSRFVRIHRSHVVSLAEVRCLNPDGAGRYVVEMSDGTRLPVSRSRSKELRDRAL